MDTGLPNGLKKGIIIIDLTGESSDANQHN